MYDIYSMVAQTCSAQKHVVLYMHRRGRALWKPKQPTAGQLCRPQHQGSLEVGHTAGTSVFGTPSRLLTFPSVNRE